MHQIIINTDSDPVPVKVVSGGGGGGGGGAGAYRSQPTINRPANTTAYTAGDVLGGAIEFASIGPAGGHILVTSADLMAAIASVPSGMAGMRMHIYDSNPTSAYADNAAWTLHASDAASYLGYIDLGTLAAQGGSNCYAQADNLNKQFKLAAGQTSLWAYLVTTGGFTPAGNSEIYKARLQAVGI